MGERLLVWNDDGNVLIDMTKNSGPNCLDPEGSCMHQQPLRSPTPIHFHQYPLSPCQELIQLSTYFSLYAVASTFPQSLDGPRPQAPRTKSVNIASVIRCCQIFSCSHPSVWKVLFDSATLLETQFHSFLSKTRSRYHFCKLFSN